MRKRKEGGTNSAVFDLLGKRVVVDFVISDYDYFFYTSFFPREEKHNTLIIYKIVWKPLIDIYVKRMFHIICKWVTLCEEIVDSILFLYVHTLWRRFIGISLYLSTRLRLRKENWKEVECFLDTSCRENMSLFIQAAHLQRKEGISRKNIKRTCLE